MLVKAFLEHTGAQLQAIKVSRGPRRRQTFCKPQTGE